MAENTQDHPNIVFIHAESMDGRKMGCMGDKAMRNATPNLDSLARDGVMFSNAYTNSPVCNPSRASMWTGKYPHYYQCWNNHEGIVDSRPTYQTVLERAGYRFNAIGPLDYGYGKHSIRDRVGSWTRAAQIHRPINRTPEPQVSEEQLHGFDWNNTYKAMDWLKEASTDSRPFMLYLTTALVHPAFQAEKKHMDRIDENAIEIPPGLVDISQEPHPADRYTRYTKNCLNAFLEKNVRQIQHTYYAMIAALDDIVGRVLTTLDDLGLRESTYIIFSSDHGEMAGEHNQILKRTMYEPSVHEPLIISGPGVQKGVEEDTPVSLVDLFPTFMDMTGLNYADFAQDDPAYPDQLDGESLMPLLTNGDKSQHRDWVMCEWHGDRACTGAFMLRRGKWKYIKHIGLPPQLFDLSSDPWEINDKAETEKEVVKEMDALLTEHFDCEAIDAQAKEYDRESFKAWREEQQKAGTYEEMMARIYSGFGKVSIEELVPWRREDEAQIQAWLGESD